MFFAQVEANNTVCEDRASMAYNELYLSYCLYVEAKKLPDEEKLLLLLRGAKKTLIMQQSRCFLKK